MTGTIELLLNDLVLDLTHRLISLHCTLHSFSLYAAQFLTVRCVACQSLCFSVRPKDSVTIGLVSYGVSVSIGKSAQQTPPTQSIGLLHH